MSAAVGDVAPAFTLQATGGQRISLGDYLGSPVVLVFYPGDDSSVCTRQLTTYNDDFSQFAALNAQLLAISAQSIESHEKFAAKHGFQFPLLADVDRAVASAYGVLGPLGFSRRSVFVIDRHGIIRYAHRAIAGLTFRPVGELVDVLLGLPS